MDVSSVAINEFTRPAFPVNRGRDNICCSNNMPTWETWGGVDENLSLTFYQCAVRTDYSAPFCVSTRDQRLSLAAPDVVAALAVERPAIIPIWADARMLKNDSTTHRSNSWKESVPR